MDTGLIDHFQRRITYLRISLTDRCDLRCFYCMPKSFSKYENPTDWLSPEELGRVVKAFSRLGIRRVRLTGGEPLLRRDIKDIVHRISSISTIDDVSLSTNGMRLAPLAKQLHQAGVARLNVSLDSLRADRFKAITGGGHLERVLQGLRSAQIAGYAPIKINMVVLRDINHDEVSDMVSFCLENNFTLRFIEAMPMGSAGRSAVPHYVDLAEVEAELGKCYDLEPAFMDGGGPARYVKVSGTSLHIGFITPMSQHFCATCNRVRLGVDGTIYPCLGDQYSTPLGPLLRNGCSDSELSEALCRAVCMKPERHSFNELPTKVVRFMSQTGG